MENYSVMFYGIKSPLGRVHFCVTVTAYFVWENGESYILYDKQELKIYMKVFSEYR